MSNNNRGRSGRTRTKKAKSAGGVFVKYSRKTRTKTRKPKYLSLVHLGENLPQMSNQQEQLNLFALHPENLVEDREDAQYDNVSLFFYTTEEDDVHAVSLNGLLDSESSDNHRNETTKTNTNTNTTVTSEESPLSPSLTYGHSGGGGGGGDHTRLLLVRSAMKGKKERDESEEKWVVYSEVVEKKNNKEMEEVSSCCGGRGGGCYEGGGGGAWCSKKKLLALKLDYEEIMNAWSDKGSLYIEGESPQTVPDTANVLVDEWDSIFNVWKVPEMVSTRSFKVKEVFDGKEGWRRGHREASVLRYKEKRQNRLFSKRIRYEVRKLNAEKRPRLKADS